MVVCNVPAVVLAVISSLHLTGAYIMQPLRVLRLPSLKCSTVGPTTSWTIQKAGDVEMPMVASFLAANSYQSTIPNGQRKELTRLELNNLRDAYGSSVGRWRYPSALFVAKDGNEIAGCVGVAFKHFIASRKEFASIVLPKISQNTYLQQLKSASLDVSEPDHVIMIVQHLSIRRDKAELGLGRTLIEHCESKVKEWGDPYLYATAYGDEKEVDKLYKTTGFKKYYRSTTTRAAPGKLALQHEKCVYYCYRKAMEENLLENTTILQRIITFVHEFLVKNL